MKIVRYCGSDWLLSGWSYTYGSKLSQKYWLSTSAKVAAITIYRHDGRQKYIVQSPDGELLDYGVVQFRRDAKRLSQRSLWNFMSHSELKFSEGSSEIQEFLK